MFSQKLTAQHRSNLQMMRVGAGLEITALIVSPRFEIFQTHWRHGRTQPCAINMCPACNDKQHTRTYGYAVGRLPHANRYNIIELPWAALTTLGENQTKEQCRGHVIRIKRQSGLSRGIVTATWDTVERIDTENEEPPEVVEVMCRIWQLPMPSEYAEITEHEKAVRRSLWARENTPLIV